MISDMTNEKFQNRFRIASARASWSAYDEGAYFVTICTGHRIPYFGEISDGEMHMTAIGQFVTDNLRTISEHYLYAEIPIFVVMPNHIHTIVFIDGNKIPSALRKMIGNIDNKNELPPRRDVARRVSTTTGAKTGAIPGITTGAITGAITVTTTGAIPGITTGAITDTTTDATNGSKNVKMQEIANQSGWLSVCIGGIKSVVTKYAHENKIDFDWQPHFHDHIIRDLDEMNRIANYIDNNVAKWESDRFYKRF